MDRTSTTAGLLCCEGDEEKNGTAFVWFTDRVSPLDVADDALGCVRLR